ncbi:YVTN family beta-propeller repeat protein [Candidatus Nitrososphaera evergladensis SR1]|uniref:YVTN family beta-propeller repeat protein n=1 Tax=Candidatus Nitrososphaera evergladensis SR1 TaxID=1459636 RepID=A0A075MUC2_9ARCH|nr:YncE family protein [Candidatus Nitrososphaera evergladensis]AIF84785.1 YVTN family beta-propeller repeat protein [Candidatus Nitrososphaera evergladensis SR1]
MKPLYLLIILAVSASFISGIGFAMLMSSSYISNEPPNHVVMADQIDNNTFIPQDNGTVFAAVNPNTNRIYVANEVSHTVSVVDGNNNKKIASIPVGAYPKIAVNPVTNRIYVTEQHMVNNIQQNGTISVIDGNNNYTKIASIEVDVNPSGIAVNPNTNKIYVTHHHIEINGKRQNGTVTVIDGNDNTKIATIQVGENPFGIAVNPNTNRIYVTNYIDGTVSVIDGNSNKVIGKPIKLDFGAEGIAVNPLANKIYVANGITATIYVIDGGDTGSKVDEIRKLFAWNVAVNPVTNKIYVPSYFFNNLSVVDGKYDNVMTVIPIGMYPD